MKQKTILAILLAMVAAMQSFTQSILLPDDSLRNLYAQYQSYTPSPEELKDYNLLKYHISWLLLDERLITENIEVIKKTEPDHTGYNTLLVIPIDAIPFEKTAKIIPLANQLIQLNANDKSVVRPLLLSKILLLEKQENYNLLKTSLPDAFKVFKDQVEITNRLKQTELLTLYNTGETQQAITLGARYYRELKSNELLKLHITHLSRSNAYKEIIALAEPVKKANLMDRFFELGDAYLKTGDTENAEKLFDLIYKNIKSPVEEEIRLSKLQVDSQALIFPEAILNYTETGNRQVFSIPDPVQLKSIGDYFFARKNRAEACDFYQYTLLNINAKIQAGNQAERYQESDARFKQSFSDFVKSEARSNALLEEMKAQVISISKQEPGCTFQIM